MNLRATFYIIALFVLLSLPGSAWASEVLLFFEKTVVNQEGIPVEGRQIQSFQIGVGKDYFYFQDENLKTIYDFDLNRVYYLDLFSKTYEEHSLFVLLGDFDSEIRRVAHEKGIEDPFPTFNKELISRYRMDLENFPKKNLDNFNRFLLYNNFLLPAIQVKIHPETDEEPSPGDGTRTVMQLKRVEKSFERANKIPKDSEREILPLRAIGEFLQGFDPKPLKPVSKKQLNEDLSSLIDQEKYLDAFLSMLEYGFETGEVNQEVADQVLMLGVEDPNLKLFLEVQKAVHDPNLVTFADKMIDDIDRDGLSKSYILDIFKANFMAQMGKIEESEALFLNALKANPNLTAVYFYLGNLYRQFNNFYAAWASWDVGLIINSEHPLWQGLNAYQLQLVKDFPDFIQNENQTTSK